MSFTYRQIQENDCIAAIATAPGEGAIAVIRLSGKTAFEISGKAFDRDLSLFKTHTAHYGKILNREGGTIDHVLLLVMQEPRSYTGENVVEISCHGGQLIARLILARLYELGARPAEPGEFSLRAFLNGKLDLAQAEAVQQLIASKNEKAMEHAAQHLDGALSKRISQFQKELTNVAAILEAWVDFPEEGLVFAKMGEIIQTLEASCMKMEQLQETFHDGKILQEGISLCLVGAPNVGKSSLMNALVGCDRAIVTEIPGTTRDVLEEDVQFGSLRFRLIDTAGIRETNEPIEQEGIRRSQKMMSQADLVLLVLDASRPLTEDDYKLLDMTSKEKRLVIWNKIDLGAPDESISSLGISARERIGLDDLRAAIEQKIWVHGIPDQGEVIITRLRHYQALASSVEACRCVIRGLQQGISAEFVTSDLRAALSGLGAILGTNVTEEILSAIFSKFCIGK